MQCFEMYAVRAIAVMVSIFGVAEVARTEVTTATWPQWRGPNGQGHVLTTGLPTTWDDSTNVKWKQTTPGRGWSSPIIAENTVWLTTALETPADPETSKARLRANTGDQPLTLLDQVELKVIGLDIESGKIMHDLSLITIREPQWVHKLNSYASPTPVYERGRLYCHFGTFGTACVDTLAKSVVWVNTDLQIMHENGPGGSPIVVGDKVVFHMDGSDQQYIVALDKETGKIVWKTDRSGELRPNPQHRKSYGTPLLVEIGGMEQIVSPATDWVYGYDPATGSERWKVSYGQLGFSLTPRPVVGHGMIYLITGFGKGQVLGIRYDQSLPPRIEWRFNRGTPTMPSPLLVEGELYFVSDTGVFTCLDALSGEEIYRERLSGNFSSSLWFADGRIYVSNREGTTYVIRAGQTFELLAKNDLAEAILATPAAVDGAIFLRTETQLYRIQPATD